MDIEIVLWVESRSGFDYDFASSLYAISGNSIFIDSYTWLFTIDEVINNLEEVFDIIEENKHDIPDNLPTAVEIKQAYGVMIMLEILKSINYIKETLSIEVIDITSFDVLTRHVMALKELVDLLKNNNIEDIYKNQLFEKHESENQNSFTTLFNIIKADLTNMSEVVNSIYEDFMESLDE